MAIDCYRLLPIAIDSIRKHSIAAVADEARPMAPMAAIAKTAAGTETVPAAGIAAWLGRGSDGQRAR